MTALYSTYRSQRFDDLVGQDATTRTLKNAISTGRVAHAYLLTGIRGTGKTSTARILAKAVNCENLQDGEPCNQCAACTSILDASATDLIEIDAASNRGIDEIRDLREKAKYLPSMFKRKVYIIDEAHQLTPEAFNALLKTLEEPPGHVLFILCTTEAHKLPPTIVSRCQRFDFRRITVEDIVGRLEHIATTEGIAASRDGLELVATMAQGSMRDAVTMLDQLASAGVESIDEAAVRHQLGLVSASELAALLAAAATGDAAGVLAEVERLSAGGADLRQLTNGFADIARKAVLVSLGAADPGQLGLSEEAARSLTDAVKAAGRDFAAGAFEAAVAASVEMKQTHDPRLLLELTLLRLASRAADVAPAVPPPEPPAHATDVTVPAPPTTERAPAPAPLPPPSPPQPPAGTQARHVAETPGTGQPADGFEAVRGRWPALLQALRGRTSASTRVYGLLADATPLAIEDDTLVIGVKWAIHSEKAQEPAHRDALDQAIAEVYGRPFRLRFTTLGAEAAPAPSLSGATEPRPGREGAVQDAIEILGARITDVRPRRSTA